MREIGMVRGGVCEERDDPAERDSDGIVRRKDVGEQIQKVDSTRSFERSMGQERTGEVKSELDLSL